MTTSGVYTLTVSRDDIIRVALLNLGKLGDNEVPTAQETTDCARMLNLLVKQWQGKADFAPGLKEWTRKHGDLFLSSTTGQYSVGPSGDNWTNQSYQRTTTTTALAAATSITVSSITNASAGDYIGITLDSGALFWTTINGAPSGSTINLTAGLPSQASANAIVYNYTTKAQRPELIETCVLRDSNFNDTPVNLMTVQDFDFLPSKANVQYLSLPQAIYYERQLGNGVIYLDVAGSSDVTQFLHITYMEPVQTFVNPTDTPYYPDPWFLALSWGLTKQIAPMFNMPFTADMKENYGEAIATARELYTEKSSMYFEPGNDSIGWSNSSR